MSRVKDSYSRRFEISSQLMQLGNIAAGSLLFGQAVSGNPYSLFIAVLGIATMISLYLIAYRLMRREI